MGKIVKREQQKRLTRGSMLHIKEREEDKKGGNKTLIAYITIASGEMSVCLLVEWIE